MASIQSRRPTLPLVMPDSMIDFGKGAAVPYSPLDQFGLAMQLGTSPLSAAIAGIDPHTKSNPTPSSPLSLTTPSAQPATPAIPALDFKLFRSPSIYSVESGESISIASTDDAVERYGYPITGEPDSSSDSETPLAFTQAENANDDFYTPTDEADVITFSTPSTPRAHRTFGSAAASPGASGAATPTTVRASKSDHRTDSKAPTYPYAPSTLRSAVSEAPFTLRAVPVRTARSASTSTSSSPTSAQPVSAARALSEPYPPATSPNATPVHQQVASPRYPETAVAPDWASVHGEQGSDWGDDENDFEWLDSSDAPEASNGQHPDGLQRRLVRHLTRRLSDVGVKAANTAAGLVSGAGTSGALTGTSTSSKTSDTGSNAHTVVDSSSSSTDGTTAPALDRRRTKKKRSYVIPRRAAPPPPPGGGITVVPVEVTRSRSPGKTRTGGAADRNSPCPDASLDVTATANKAHDAHTNMDSNFAGAEERPLPPVVVITATPPRQGPAMMPLKDVNSPSGISTAMHKSVSYQSAYSFYDLGGEGSDSPARSERQVSDTFPRGKYARVPLHELNVTDTPPSSSATVQPRIDVSSKHVHRPSADDALAAVARRPLRSPGSSATLARAQTTKRAPTMAEADLMSTDELVAAGLQQREAGDKPKSAWLFMKAAELGSVTGQIHWGISLRHG